MFILMSKVESYQGFKEPEKVEINEKLDMYIYLPIDLEQDYMVGLVRNFNFDITEPFLMQGDTMMRVFTSLGERGLS